MARIDAFSLFKEEDIKTQVAENRNISMNHTIATIKRCTDHIRQNILHCMLLSNCSKYRLRK